MGKVNYFVINECRQKTRNPTDSIFTGLSLNFLVFTESHKIGGIVNSNVLAGSNYL